ncbi:MAG: MFS transporter [Alphaproteobacteria bacterium]|nr:MFS transporter [Alphaproteobacteria bacterium]MBV9584945.1 MFS transporter [Alphaproteobacteria bacterium]
MAGQTSDELLAIFDSAPLNRRYWVAFVLLSGLFVLEFFDFLVVGYLLAVVAPQWHLTYGQSAIMLYSGGVGAILGALVFGAFSDRWGRKWQMIIGTFICAAASGLMGIVPTGAWEVFAVLRFFIGVGLTAGVTPSLACQVELTPTRHRTLLTTFYLVFASAGGFLASGVSAALIAPIGWRGVAMLGMAPAIVGVLIWLWCPESVRWLVAKGRFVEARDAVAKYLGVAPATLPLPTQAPAAEPSGKLRELYERPSLFWETVMQWGGASTAGYGVYLFGPTIVAMVLHVPVPVAAKYFIFVSLGGVIGKIIVTILSPLTGRRWLGAAWGYGGLFALAAAGYFSQVLIGDLPLMVVLLACSTFFIEGSFANFAPYTVERYGVRLGARASGLGQTANGVGKIIGPLSLALIAGTSNIVSPQASENAVLPAYIFLGFCMFLVGLSFTVLGVETHGRAMGDEEEGAAAATPAVATPSAAS